MFPIVNALAAIMIGVIIIVNGMYLCTNGETTVVNQVFSFPRKYNFITYKMKLFANEINMIVNGVYMSMHGEHFITYKIQIYVNGMCPFINGAHFITYKMKISVNRASIFVNGVCMCMNKEGSFTTIVHTNPFKAFPATLL
jgi:hypothetical protein